MSVKYQGKFTIRTYEVDHKKQLNIPALVELMHEAAMQNVMDLKLSVWDMEAESKAWVLMRKQLQIDRLPLLGETIYITTYPAGFERAVTYRDYIVTDVKGNPVASMGSSWLLMDTVKRRMSPIPQYMHEYDLPKPEDCLPRPSFRAPKFGTADLTKDYKVDWYDMDFNGHLSNVNYVRWLLGTMPDAYLKDKNVQKLSFSYKQECHWKEELRAETQALSNTDFLHRLVKGDGKVAAIAYSTWG